MVLDTKHPRNSSTRNKINKQWIPPITVTATINYHKSFTEAIAQTLRHHKFIKRHNRNKKHGRLTKDKRRTQKQTQRILHILKHANDRDSLINVNKEQFVRPHITDTWRQ